MKRTPVSLDELAARDNLVLATWKAARGKRTRPEVQAFLADLDGSLPGTLRLTRRKQRRYRALRTEWEGAWAGGQIDALRLQQGYAAVLAPTLPADAAAWRREDLRRHPCLYDDELG